MFHRAIFILSLFLFSGVAAELPVSAIRFDGDWPLSDRARQRLVSGVDLGEPFDPEAAQAVSNRLMEALRTEYYPLARVRWSAGPDADGTGLTARFAVEAGPRGTVTEVRFAGNESFSDEALRKVLKTVPKSSRWARLTGRDVLLTETLAVDQQALADLYQGAGYMDVVIGVPELLFVGEGEDGGFRLIWPVEEGPQYRIGLVTVNGEKDAVSGKVFGEQIASPARLRETGQGLRARLDQAGHAFAEVELQPDWRPEAGRVDLAFRVSPGPVSTFRALKIEGNTRTHPRVVQRELAAVPGARFDRESLAGFARRLEQTGLFERVDVTLVPVENGQQFDVLAEVGEAHTGRVEGGVTFGDVEGLAFVTTLRERNFALRPPFRGQALEADVGLTLGSEILRVEAGLGNPRLGQSFWSLNGRVFFEDNAYISDRYDQESTGGSLMAFHPLGRRHFLGFGWMFSMFELQNIDPALDVELRESDRKVELSGPRGVWSFDATDRSFRPRSGGRMRQELLVGLAGLGGETEVADWQFRGEVFFGLPRDAVLRIHASTRHIFPAGDTSEVPLSLRTDLGGADTLKAFEYRSVSGVDPAGVARGGEGMWWGGPEILIPAAARLDVAIYTHLGDVSDTAGSFSGGGPVAEWGIGFLIRAENFPVRFDVAFPLSVSEEDPVNEVGEARFSFSAAYRF